MALALYDRVKETTTTVGTGSVTLLGATTGFQSFAVVGNANTTYYCIADQGGANWEVGIGTYTASGTTLARTTVLSSSNAGSLVTFTAGVKDVFVTYPSSKGLWKDASGNAIGLGTPASGVVTNLTGTASININGTVGATTATTGAFTTLAYTGTLTGGTGVVAIGTSQIYKDASGNVGIGTSSPNNKFTVGAPNTNGGSNCVASFSGVNVAALNTSGMVVITPTDSIASDIGGSIGFAANGTIMYPTGTIAGRRENATANNYASYMQFATCSSGGTVSEKMRIDSSGNVGIGTSSPNASAILDAQSTTKGVRMPNMTTTQKNAIATPAAGLMVFDTTLAKLCVYSGAAWQTITSI